MNKINSEKTIVCVVGMGYVGLPLAKAFSKCLRVIGYDKDADKLRKLKMADNDPNLLYTTDPAEMKKADFTIICVPTPVTSSKEPDLSYIIKASESTGRNLKRNCTVILESTVFPGTTEEIVKPILEKESGLKCGPDFKIGYSPERINPGDEEHGIEKVTKVVSGMDEETTELVAQLYRMVAPNVFKAKNIKTAEAAKVIENIQRDLNIALMNELSIIFKKLGLNTKEVLDAAATKWNFHRYSPGLVGGHCIPVDPYYLVYKSRELGYHPQVILAGRAINDSMAKHLSEITVKALNSVDKVIKGSKILIMGLTYKENVADTRETPVKEIIKELREYGVEVWGYDPLLSGIEDEFGIPEVRNLPGSKNYDVVILAVGHDKFKEFTLEQLKGNMNSKPILVDVRGIFSGKEAEQKGFVYCSL